MNILRLLPCIFRAALKLIVIPGSEDLCHVEDAQPCSSPCCNREHTKSPGFTKSAQWVQRKTTGAIRLLFFLVRSSSAHIYPSHKVEVAIPISRFLNEELSSFDSLLSCEVNAFWPLPELHLLSSRVPIPVHQNSTIAPYATLPSDAGKEKHGEPPPSTSKDVILTNTINLVCTFCGIVLFQHDNTRFTTSRHFSVAKTFCSTTVQHLAQWELV